MNSTEPEFVSLALDQVRPSPRNPRKTFDAASLDQLAASIAAKGVLEPILVRPRTLWQRVCGFVMGQKRIMDADGQGYGLGVGQFEGAGIAFGRMKKKSLYDDVIGQLLTEWRIEKQPIGYTGYRPGPKALDPVTDKDPLGLGIDHYELICGERRWRASTIAGKETVPALVRDLDDHEAAEIRVIENDQREDVPPLEQAEGYADLIAMGDDVESIAAKIGRPAKYVTARLTLMNLIPTLKSDLRTGKLPFGHAHILARLPAVEQTAFLQNEGLYEVYGQNRDRVVSISEIKRDLRDYTPCLSGAPWKWDDATLVPAAGSCSACLKRSGAKPTLFDELIADDERPIDLKAKPKAGKPEYCTDRTCYATKQTAFVELQLKSVAEKSEGTAPLKISTRYMPQTEGVIGTDRYQVVTKKEAKAAKPGELKQAVVVEGDGIGHVVTVRVKKQTTARLNDGHAAQEKKRREEAKAENRARIICLGKVADAVVKHGPDLDTLVALAKAMADVAGGEVCRWIADRREIPPAKNAWEQAERVVKHAGDLETTDEALGLIAELIAGKHAQYGLTREGRKSLWTAFGIPLDEVRKQAKAEPAKPEKPHKAKAKKKAVAK